MRHCYTKDAYRACTVTPSGAYLAAVLSTYWMPRPETTSTTSMNEPLTPS
jgi:hypothetical protein